MKSHRDDLRTCNQRERSINRRHVYTNQTASRERSINRRHVYTNHTASTHVRAHRSDDAHASGSQVVLRHQRECRQNGRLLVLVRTRGRYLRAQACLSQITSLKSVGHNVIVRQGAGPVRTDCVLTRSTESNDCAAASPVPVSDDAMRISPPLPTSSSPLQNK